MEDYTDIGPCLVARLTDKAALIRTAAGDYWIPLSLVKEETLAEIDPDNIPHNVEEFEVVTWFAEKESVE